MKPSIVVLGSLNMDFLVSVKHLPSPGETVLGHGFQMVPGGKGANQACAAGKLAGAHAQVKMIGRVGIDVFGDTLKASLAAAGVDVSAVHGSRTQPTGIALIAVEASGQNSIVVASGANMDIQPGDVASFRKHWTGGGVALFQLETPLATVATALRMARDEGMTTILDPAPAQPLDRDLLGSVDILTPNESEALGLLDQPARRLAPAEAGEIAHDLRALGPRVVIVKLGDSGCFCDDGAYAEHIPAFRVEARDTTAAGDTFNAGLAVALAESKSLPEAIRFASAAAAISVTRIGAQSSAPMRGEVVEFLARS